MKGTFFQKPLELNLLVEGESWIQGTPISGSLTIRNHGNEPIDGSALKVQLAHGTMRKVHLKSPGAFDVLQTAPVSVQTIAPGATGTIAWKFETDRNCPITDTTTSLYLLYGRGEATEALGQLQLSFVPDPIIEEFLKSLSINSRFVTKARKHRKGRVEVKLDPPDSKAFGSLDELVLSFRFEGESLEVEYGFNLKKVEATAAGADVIKSKRGMEQVFRPDQLRLPSGRVNHESIDEALREALSTVESKVIF